MHNCKITKSDIGQGRRVGSSELSADCSYKDRVQFVPTKNFRTSNIFSKYFNAIFGHIEQDFGESSG